MDRLQLRIFSKVGLLSVIIGFFMPVCCNLNGFQLAQYASSFGQLNILSLALYGILLFSCLGGILLLVLVMKIPFSMKWDWIATIGTISSALLVFFNLNGGSKNSSGTQFQSGAYVMLIGMAVSLLFLVRAYNRDKNDVPQNTSEIQRETPPTANPINTTMPNTQIGNSQKIFCSQCGSKLKQGYIFCSNCGAKI